MEIEVRHDPDRERFFVNVDGHEAYLQYALVDEGTADFRSTFTPPELRGRGLMREIVRQALAWARGEGKEVIPSCSYVWSYLEKERSP